jgi:ligand-binding sensor domain-containing protein
MKSFCTANWPLSVWLRGALAGVLLLWVTPGVLRSQTAAPNYVLSLGGTNGYLQLPRGAFNDLEEVTIEGWVKWADDIGFRRFFDFGKEGTAIYLAQLEAGRDIMFECPPRAGLLNGSRGSEGRLFARDFFRTNQWTHLAVVLARDRIALYVNGNLAASRPFETPFNRLDAGEHNRLGRDNWSGSGYGNIPDTKALLDEFRIWRAALTKQQISANLFRRLTGTESNLVCLLNFDNQTATDSSPRANVVKLEGNASIIAAPFPKAEELLPTALISGRVTYADGRPAAGSLVRVDRDWKNVTTALTDADGYYELAVRPAAGEWELSAVVGPLGAWKANLQISLQTHTKADVVLAELGTISGTLLAFDGSPHARITVKAEDAATGHLAASSASDARGDFEFHNLRPGSYRIRAQGAMGAVYYENGKVIEVLPGKTISRVDLRFAPSAKGAWDTLNSARGLASDSEIRKILFDPDGSVWFATQGGVSRFDGDQFVNFTVEDGLPDNSVLNMARDSRGNLWFSTSTGIARYDGRKIDQWGGSLMRGLNFLDAIYADPTDPSGRVWFGTGSNPSVFSFDGKTFSWYTGNHGPPQGVKKMAGDGKGGIWMASSTLLHFDGTNFVDVLTPLGVHPVGVDTPSVDRTGKVWVGAGAAALCYDGTNAVRYDRTSGLALDDVLCTHVAQDGTVWLAGRGGVSRFDGTNFINFTKEDGLPSDHIIFVASSPEGVMYFGSFQDGAGRYEPTTFISYTTAYGLAVNSTWQSFVAADGSIWFGHDHAAKALDAEVSLGLSRFDGHQLTTVTNANRAVTSSSFAQSRDGTVWVPVGQDGLLACKMPESVQSVLPAGLSRVRAVAGAGDGSIWAGGAGGLSHFVDGRWQHFPWVDGNDVSAILCDPKGNIWAGSTREPWLWRFEGDGLRPLAAGAPITGSVFNIYPDRDGSIWFATAAGAVRFDGKEFTRLTKSKGKLPHSIVQCVFRDRENILWFGTRGGAARFDGVVWSTLTKADGLLSSDVRTICQDNQGAIWFGTDRGVTSYLRPRSRPPHPRGHRGDR